MPRKRMLWPGFFESEQLAQLPLEVVYTFAGMWVFGDDRGRILDDADALWGDVWLKRRRQVTMDDVADHFDMLVNNGQVCRYQVGGGRFLHVIAWDEHQKINHPTPSKLPPCVDHQALEYKGWWRDVDTATERWRSAEKAALAARSDSGSDSLSRSPETEESLTRLGGATNSQCSSVQLRSVQAESGSGSLNSKPVFTRPSQDRKLS